jgi:multimeric flavodoxin WrbA
MTDDRLVVLPIGACSSRLGDILRTALEGLPCETLSALPEQPMAGRRILFAASLDRAGLCGGLNAVLYALRTIPRFLAGSVCGIVIDGESDLYTKSAARELAFSVNRAGCCLPGRPLVEATGTLANFTVQAGNGGCSLEEAYRRAVRSLVERVLGFAPPRSNRPNLCVLHASSRKTSNTLALWGMVRERLADRCDIREIGLRNGTLEDCGGCPYTTCLHFGEKGDCFYGGVMVQEVYPAVRDADAVVVVAPNYNDALAANLTACINRLTALYRTVPFDRKALFGIVVSGYSGGDIVAAQLIGALCMNKGFWLPANACLLETANNAGTAVHLPGIAERTDAFADGILRQLCV